MKFPKDRSPATFDAQEIIAYSKDCETFSSFELEDAKFQKAFAV